MAVIFGFFAIAAGYVWADTVIALGIALLIAKEGINIIRESSEVLLDKSIISDDIIENIVNSVPGVNKCSCYKNQG